MKMKRILAFLLLASALVLALAACGDDRELSGFEHELHKRNAYTFSDGVSVDLWLGFADREYYKLADGTEILYHQAPVHLGKIGVGGIEGYDGLPDAAKEKVDEYFNMRGELYSVEVALEAAYEDYKDAQVAGREFQEHPIICDDYPCGENDYYLSVMTEISGTDDKHYAGNLRMTRMSVIFDRETGETVDVYSLFTVDKAQVQERLVGFFGDMYDKDALLDAFDSACIHWCGDIVEVEYPAYSVEGMEHNHTAAIDIEDIADIMTEKALAAKSDIPGSN